MAIKVSEPINTYVEKSAHSRNTLVVDIDGMKHSIDFRSGGELKNPVNYQALPHGGISADGLYEEWVVEGEVTISQSLYSALLEMHRRSGKMGKPRGATHRSYVAIDGGVTVEHAFRQVIVATIPQVSISELGKSTGTVAIKFSLNDLIATGV